MGRRFSFRFIFCERSRLKTEAESVDDMVAASSREAIRVSSMLVRFHSDKRKMKLPVSRVVSRTPTVERMIPGVSTGLMSWYLVSIPPENRMILRAIIPINWASSALLNWSPRPSLPKNIPTSKNRSKVGIPNR